MLKRQIQACLRSLFSKNLIWYPINKVFEVVANLHQKLEYYRLFTKEQLEEQLKFKQQCEEPFLDRVVLNGPFKGMKYPKLEAVGSEIFPKLLGSYEMELWEALDYVLARDYSAIVDIGCAEGYYAIGLGMRLKSSVNYAFDTDPRALALCRSMAELNGVKVETGGFCTPTTLRTLPLGKRSLIICDCEGYELELFEQDLCDYLSPHDILIESHDAIDISTTKTLTDRLSRTHEIQIFMSVDDREKAYAYDFPQLKDLDLSVKYSILKERPFMMKWIFAKTKVAEN